jgi:hypothetical protein
VLSVQLRQEKYKHFLRILQSDGSQTCDIVSLLPSTCHWAEVHSFYTWSQRLSIWAEEVLSGDKTFFVSRLKSDYSGSSIVVPFTPQCAVLGTGSRTEPLVYSRGNGRAPRNTAADTCALCRKTQQALYTPPQGSVLVTYRTPLEADSSPSS